MDLPTTDPGSDFPDYYTTEDECETDYDTNLPRVGKILRGDMRKANSASCEAMPPELIITKVSRKDLGGDEMIIKCVFFYRSLMTINKLV